MGRLDTMPGPGDFPIPDPECSRRQCVYGDACNLPGHDWCDTHDQPWRECGGMEPDYDDEPVNP